MSESINVTVVSEGQWNFDGEVPRLGFVDVPTVTITGRRRRETAAEFRQRVAEVTGMRYRSIPVVEGEAAEDAVLGGGIVARRGSVFVVDASWEEVEAIAAHYRWLLGLGQPEDRAKLEEEAAEAEARVEARYVRCIL